MGLEEIEGVKARDRAASRIKKYKEMQAELDELNKKEKRGKLGKNVVKQIEPNDSPIDNVSGLPFPQNPPNP